MTSHFIATAASVALLGAGFAGAEGTRSAQALPGHSTVAAATEAGAGKRCRVDVIRTGTPGVADIVRDELTDGTCVCIVTTGEPARNGSAENVVLDLLRNRTCDGAPAPVRGVTEAATAGSGGGGAGVLLPVLISTGGAAGLAVAMGNDSKG